MRHVKRQRFSALAFKVVADPFIGRLVYLGYTLESLRRSSVYNATKSGNVLDARYCECQSYEELQRLIQVDCCNHGAQGILSLVTLSVYDRSTNII